MGAANLRYELDPYQFRFRVYDDSRSNVSYISSAVLTTNGSVGWCMNVSNKAFFQALFENIDEIFTRLGITVLESPMNPVMAKAVEISCQGRGILSRGRTEVHDGHDLVWMRLERLPAQSDGHCHG